MAGEEHSGNGSPPDAEAVEANPSTSPFVQIPASERIVANELAFAVRDRFPVSPGHTLVVPFREVPQWFDASADEQQAIMALVAEVRAVLLDDDRRAQAYPGLPRPDGFNVGFNAGDAAGQTVHHLHVHVIPRFSGDVADPAGGVRHLIPGKGNYLHEMRERTAAGSSEPANAPTETARGVAAGTAPGTAVADSPAEAALGQHLESGELIQRVLSLLDDGRRAATYKPALLLALVELCLERADGSGSLTLPLSDVADRVMALYWPHSRPYSPTGEVLRQSTTPRSRILEALARLRADSGATAATPLARVASFHAGAYARARSEVAMTLAMQPIPRLQRPGTVGTSVDYPRFLYDDSQFRAEGRPRTSNPAIVLRPGVAQALARSAPLMRIAVQDVWTREVVHINRMRTEEEQLRTFLFGAGRLSLRAVAEGFRDAGVRGCFWCNGPLSDVGHVDHVIPWSFYANDDLANLVLTDATCNTDKRDRLVTSTLVQRWLARDPGMLSSLAADIQWPLDSPRTVAVATTAYRYLADGMPLWAGRRDVSLMDDHERARVLAALGQ